MKNQDILKSWVIEALKEAGEPLSVVDVAKHIWNAHEADLQVSGDLFYTWQYSMRWAAQVLRDEGLLTLDGRKWALK